MLLIWKWVSLFLILKIVPAGASSLWLLTPVRRDKDTRFQMWKSRRDQQDRVHRPRACHRVWIVDHISVWCQKCQQSQGSPVHTCRRFGLTSASWFGWSCGLRNAPLSQSAKRRFGFWMPNCQVLPGLRRSRSPNPLLCRDLGVLEPSHLCLLPTVSGFAGLELGSPSSKLSSFMDSTIFVSYKKVLTVAGIINGAEFAILVIN